MNAIGAMQHDDWEATLTRLKDSLNAPKYILGASYFIEHGLHSCKQWQVNFEHRVVNKCKEHTHTSGDSTYDQTIVDALQKGAIVVTFYDREDNPVYSKKDEEGGKQLSRTDLYDHISSSAHAQQFDKLDPNAKPIAVRATVTGPVLTNKSLLRRIDEWCCPYIYFYDKKDRIICQMPIEGYSGDDQLCEHEKATVTPYMELAESFFIKDERTKKGCCGCCVLV